MEWRIKRKVGDFFYGLLQFITRQKTYISFFSFCWHVTSHKFYIYKISLYLSTAVDFLFIIGVLRFAYVH